MGKQLTNIDFGTVAKPTGILDPVNPTDAVNLQYLQAFVRGLVWKAAARAASTGNIVLTAPGASIDGVTMAANDRFVAKNQTNAFDNGVYVWNGAAVAATRATDANTAALLSGLTITVTEGTTNANTVWTQTVDPPITLGTTNLAFAQVGGGGSAYTAAASGGLSLTANAFSILLDTAPGLVLGAGGIKVDRSVFPVKYSANNATTGTSEVVTHNLGTKDVDVTIRLISTDEIINADVVATSTNTVTISYATSQTAGTLRFTIMG